MRAITSVIILAVALVATSSADGRTAGGDPVVVARVKPILTLAGKRFKDLNANGRLDPYEDWRLPVDRRIDDLIGRMRLSAKTPTWSATSWAL